MALLGSDCSECCQHLASRMPQQPGKRRRVGAPNGVAGSSFAGEGKPDDAGARRRAGDQLQRAFMGLYASQKISAKDFAVLNHWSDLAGVLRKETSTHTR